MQIKLLKIICYNNVTMDNGLNYNSITNYYKEKFGGAVYKLALDISATCPNRDGTIGTGGCIYCCGAGSGDYATIYNQLAIAKSRLKDKQCGKYIAYFQSYTNTYMPVERLSGYINEVLSDKEICGISIATRPDCINEDMLCYLKRLNQLTHLVVELGLQSIHNESLKLINRGHTFEDFLATFGRLKSANIRVCVHLMNGLPNENKENMLDTIKVVSRLKPHSIKLHCVYIPKGTILEQMYLIGEYKPLEMEEYIDILVEELKILDKEIYIERLTGDGERSSLVAPEWTLHKRYFLNQLNKKLAQNK